MNRFCDSPHLLFHVKIHFLATDNQSMYEEDVVDDTDSEMQSERQSPTHPYPDELFFMLYCYAKNPHRPKVCYFHKSFLHLEPLFLSISIYLIPPLLMTPVASSFLYNRCNLSTHYELQKK